MTINADPSIQTSLLDKVWPASVGSRFRRAVILAVGGTVLLTVCAKIQIPVGEVPITLQTFAVLLIGAAYGWRLGGATLFLYLGEGLAGLPVFAGPVAGPAYFAGPTAGYLLGFVLAVVVVGGLAERGWDRNPATLFVAMLAGNALLYVPGLLWLQGFTGWDGVLQAGLFPFLFGDALKLALVIVLLPLGWDLSERLRGSD